MARDQGGLGIKRQRRMNEALLIQLRWRFLTNNNALWVQVWKAKYGNAPFEDVWGRKRTGSSVFHALRKIWRYVLAGARWGIGNGETADFWKDKWASPSSNLYDVALGTIPTVLLDRKVNYFVTEGGSWRWELFSPYLPTRAILQIAATPSPRAGSGCDRLYWSPSPTGKFSTKSAYVLLENGGAEDPSRKILWRTIWRWPGPQRIRAFLWLLAKNRFLTNVERSRRHLTTNTACVICGRYEKTALHVVRECTLALDIWIRLLPIKAHGEFFTLSLEKWLSLNLSHSSFFGLENWPCTFGVVAWKVWKWRNEFIFQNKRMDIRGAMMEIATYVEGLKITFDGNKKLGGTGSFGVPRWLSWDKP
ncbi:Unknown protein [Striga hermonthica]|uniref:Reverse transcriptase zinc-binding domain-containing protein n=1 Tax=Striga hermonthica TaxID=68872 RepID=A0A9N7MMM1_STRHE|nr:Unknown protein [Striga hermonthica]